MKKIKYQIKPRPARRREDTKLRKTPVKIFFSSRLRAFALALVLVGFFGPVPSSVLFGQTMVSATPLPEEGRSLFVKAQKYFQDKDYRQAKDILNQLVAKHPLDDYIPKARLLLANLQEDFTISIAQFKELASEYSDRPEGEEAQRNLGARYYLADKYSDAAESYQDFLKDHPKSSDVPEARYWLASSLSAMDQDKEAAEQYKKVAQDSPDSPWAPKALMGLGNSYFKMKKYGDAQNQYLKILDQYHFYDELNLVYFKLGQNYEMEQKPKEAHAAYQTLLEQYPKSFEVAEAQTRMADLEGRYPDLPKTVAVSPEPTVTPAAEVQAPVPTPLASPIPAAETSLVAVPAQSPEAMETQVSKPEISKPFHVQIGVFSKKLNVDKAQKELEKAGFQSFVVKARQEGVPYTYLKVRVGNFLDRASAEKTAKEITKKTKEKAIVVED